MPASDPNPNRTPNHSPPPGAGPRLQREIGLRSAVVLNTLEMIGVGPFITLPLIVGAMGGPQAMLGWVLGAALAACDGLVWAELGAAMPEAGGSYAFLRTIYGERRWGRLLAFLYAWQFTFSAPLVVASGAIGLAQYAAYLYPQLSAPLGAAGTLLGRAPRTTALAIAVCVLVVALLYRRLRAVEALAGVLWAGAMLTLAAVIGVGLTHFHPSLAFAFPPGAFHPNAAWWKGLGAATLIATYDYWGYYTICFLGAEVREPGRVIPRAILLSIAIIAALYLVMNVSVLGVVPWRELAGEGTAHLAAIAVFMERTLGPGAARVAAGLVIWTAFGSLFSLLLGGSRVPYAAARDGNYFGAFAQLDSRGGFPARSLLLLGALACVFCLFDLRAVIQALVALRIALQFVLQQVGVVVLRRRDPGLARPFRMWFYPLPAMVACLGSLFILVSRPGAGRELLTALVVGLSGAAIFLLRAWRAGQWPFRGRSPGAAPSSVG